MCYDLGFIDFTLFNAALVIGKKDNNDLRANGVGKTTIFKAIEYVLFNQVSDLNLEECIREEQPKCRIVFDFLIGGQEYRLARSRTRKGVSDLSFAERNAEIGTIEEIYHDSNSIPVIEKKFWKDISGRRTGDTEKDLAKLIKVNYKSFGVFVHFMQNDFTGLTTATPEKRKGILKDALNLAIYTKLEKLAKEKFSILDKEANRLSSLIEALGDPKTDNITFSKQVLQTNQELEARQKKLSILQEQQAKEIVLVNQLINQHAIVESKSASLVSLKTSAANELSKTESSFKEYQTKKANAIKSAKELVIEIKELEKTQLELVSIDYEQIKTLTDQIVSNKEKIAQLNLTIENDMKRCNKLKIPLPIDGECEHCRQPLSQEHRLICQTKINEEMQEKQNNMQLNKKEIKRLSDENILHQQKISSISNSKQMLDATSAKLNLKRSEHEEKKSKFQDYSDNLTKYTKELAQKQEECQRLEEESKSSSLEEANLIQIKIDEQKKVIAESNKPIDVLNKEINHFNNQKAILEHNIQQRTEDLRKKENFATSLKSVDDKLTIYPFVLQAFSSTGIPNLIIQNILDDLQIEANNLLAQLNPILQLSFLIEKTKDGVEVDTLDIKYLVNGKRRYYGQLSGAQKLAMTFSLKLGLSFLLQNMIGMEVKFLLLDELDQGLDKATIDDYADLIKVFQKDFTILVITHNDRLQKHFDTAVLVEQNIDEVSTARVVNSW